MKKQYTKPCLQVVELADADIICTSGPQTVMDFSDSVGTTDDEGLKDIWGIQW